jgi:hypothetical protein
VCCRDRQIHCEHARNPLLTRPGFSAPGAVARSRSTDAPSATEGLVSLPLNPQQEEVAAHYRGRALVLAGPGSGKTSTITARIGRLLGKGVLPAHILCITFTNKAAQEMRERMLRQYGAAGKKITICTFHALCGTLLRQHGRALGYTPRMTILDSEDQERSRGRSSRAIPRSTSPSRRSASCSCSATTGAKACSRGRHLRKRPRRAR